MDAKYSIPKVNKSKENSWYVHLRYNGIQKRYKKNLNLIKDLKERCYSHDSFIKKRSSNDTCGFCLAKSHKTTRYNEE